MQGIAVVLMLALVRNKNDYLLYALAGTSSSIVLASRPTIFYIRKKPITYTFTLQFI